MNNNTFINGNNNTSIKVINNAFISGNNNTFINHFNDKFVRIGRARLRPWTV
ncbi:MAG: hypothetical protein ABIK78_06110 [candidate division WOR-3 bacterium]